MNSTAPPTCSPKAAFNATTSRCAAGVKLNSWGLYSCQMQV
jgi:hypothetical protein